MSYATPYHISCVGLSWKILCTAYHASLGYILMQVRLWSLSSVYNSKMLLLIFEFLKTKFSHFLLILYRDGFWSLQVSQVTPGCQELRVAYLHLFLCLPARTLEVTVQVGVGVWVWVCVRLGPSVIGSYISSLGMLHAGCNWHSPTQGMNVRIVIVR